MPQATSEQRAEWADDSVAVKFLKAQGYKLLRNWQWQSPRPLHVATVKERSAIAYLINEWDYGPVRTEE